MKCEQPGCEKNAKVVCSVHTTKFCNGHYIKHSSSCANIAICIDLAQELRRKQITLLDIKVAENVEQIIGIANNLVTAINQCVKNTLHCLDQQKMLVMDMIQLGKPETQINQLLELFPAEKFRENNSLQGLLDIERKFNLKDFKKKVKNIEKRFEAIENVAPKVVRPLINPVFESLDKRQRCF